MSKVILQTDFGKLRVLKPILPKKIKSDFPFTYSILEDNSKSALAFHSLRESSNPFLIFGPSTRYGNSAEIFNSVRKRVVESYFGTSKKLKNPFRSCKLPNEIFYKNREIRLAMLYQTSRIGFISDRTGEILIKHRSNSNLIDNITIQSIIKAEIDSLDEEESFIKPDYFISAEFVQGIVSYYGYNKNGVTVPSLLDRKIYPQYGVFLPTRKDYLELFDAFLKERAGKILKHINSCADLGTGCGVLSFILAQNNFSKIYSIDNNENALFTVKSNAETLGYDDRIKPLNIDLVKQYLNSSKGAVTSELAEFDLIVSNPPWLNASYTTTANAFENAVFDPKLKFLRSAFKFAGISLRRDPSEPFKPAQQIHFDLLRLRRNLEPQRG